MAGVTENGLEIKTFRDIVADVQAELDDGDSGIVITDESNKIANNVAMSIILAITEAWQFTEEVYNSANIYKATGTSLDKLVTYRRLIRLAAEQSTGQVEMFCTGRTVVNSNTRFRDTRGRLLTCSDNRTLGTSLFRSATITLGTVVTGVRYYLVIAGTEYSYTAQAGDTDTEVLAGIKQVIDSTSSSSITTTVTDTSLTFNIILPENASVIFHPNIVLGDFSSLVTATAVDTGPLNFPANSVTSLVNPVASVISVTNPESFTVGRDEETDSELRARFLRTPAATREATVDSILRAVDNIEDVETTKLINNPSDSTSVDGLPPHSFEVIVEGGDDTLIANTIFQRAAAGIQSFGSTTVVVEDSKGGSHSIGFSRPTPLYIFFKVTYEPLSSGSVPSNIETLIKDAIVAYSEEMTSSDNIIPSRFSVPIYNNVTGLGEVIVEAGSSTNQSDTSPVGGYSTDRITLGIREASVIESSRITVIEQTLP